MLIGFFPGLLCGGILIFGLFLSGILEGFNLGQAATVEVTKLVEQIVQVVVTSTPDPNQPTAEPQMVVVTATPNLEAPIVNLQPPTATSTSLALPTATSQVAGATSPQSVEGTLASSTNPQPTVATAAPITTTGSIPAALQGIVTRLQPIPGGTFTMGTTVNEILNAVNQCVQRDQGACDVGYGEDSTPPVQVQLESFQMEENEVTFAQYVAFLNYLRSQGRSHRDGCLGFLCIQTVNESSDALITFDSANYNVVAASANFPVYAVTWYGAQAYCQAIGRRLPTEAEWEYAARGGSSDTLYPWGNEWSEANARVRIKTDTVFGPVAIKQYSPHNGLYDMAGNMAEWVADWYNETYYQQMANQTQPVFNPQGPPTALQKVLRGGSWDALPFFARSVHRQSEFPAPDNLSDSFPRSIGFRCAADITEGAALPPSSLGTDPTTLLTITVVPGAAAPPEAATQTTSGTNRG
jgi:formylglycine-generating enzyme required for sulfatase activity